MDRYTNRNKKGSEETYPHMVLQYHGRKNGLLINDAGSLNIVPVRVLRGNQRPYHLFQQRELNVGNVNKHWGTAMAKM